MAARVLGTEAPPRELVGALMAKAEGVPLFVEEVTKTLLDLGVLRRENGGYRMVKGAAEMSVPDTIQGAEDNVGHPSAIANLGQLDQRGAVGKSSAKISRRTKCETSLPDTSWPDETDEPGRGELLPDLSELAAAADEARRLGGQIPQSVARPGHFADNDKPAD